MLADLFHTRGSATPGRRIRISKHAATLKSMAKLLDLDIFHIEIAMLVPELSVWLLISASEPLIASS